MKKLLIILGPTSTGKTDLALQLAHKFQGELVSVDSRQVYKGLDIGTGKMPGKFRSLKMESGRWIVDNIPIHLYDIYNPKKQYTVYGYIKDAYRVIKDIEERDKLPIIVGGTGLYLKGLLESFPNLGIPADKKLRKELEKLTKVQLQNRLKKISAKKWANLNSSDRENPRRLVRAIELSVMSLRGLKGAHTRRVETGNLIKNQDRHDPIKIGPRDDVLKIGLTAPREILDKKINSRAQEWLKLGIIDEVKNLIKHGIPKKRIKETGLEYAVILEYLDNKISKDELVRKMQTRVRQYAKRQITWFKKEKDVNWFDISDRDTLNKVENLVSKWYYQSNAA